jgi:hypothetical protein
MKKAIDGFTQFPVTGLLALTATSAEMMFASARVIRHRTERMMKPGPSTADDQRELRLMTEEKIAAAADSSRSVSALWLTMWNELAVRVLSAQRGATAALVTLAESRTADDIAAGHDGLSATVASMAAVPSRLAESAVQLLQQSVAPFHSAAVGNAKRLGAD